MHVLHILCDFYNFSTEESRREQSVFFIKAPHTGS